MFTTFNYNKSDEAMFNDIVDGALESVKLFTEGVKDRKAYDELQKDLNNNIAKYLTDGTRFSAQCEKDGGAVLKNPNVTKNTAVREKFDAVIAEIINTVIPTVVSQKLG